MNDRKAAALGASLNFNASREALPLAQSFAEGSARAFGLDDASALALALAAEEFFLHLLRNLPAGAPLKIDATGYRGHVEFAFDFQDSGAKLDLRPFNITAKRPSTLDDDLDVSEMGLLLAARSVDSFAFSEEHGRVRLRLVKERRYDEPVLPAPAEGERRSAFTIRSPRAEELPFCAALLKGADVPLPDFLSCPEKGEALLSTSFASALVAVQADGLLRGIVAWTKVGDGKAIECFGPYPFASGDERAPQIAKSLLDAFVSSICKGDAALVVAKSSAPAFLESHFEPLPGAASSQAFFRLLKEDAGATLWIVPELEDYVRSACASSYLPRHFASLTPSPSGKEDVSSVFFTALDRKAKSAVLHPVRYGSDLSLNIEEHLAALRAEGFSKISCHLDLGVPWHCRFAPALLAASFKPGVLLPLYGSADVLLMEAGA